MLEIKETLEFSRWLSRVKDRVALVNIAQRIQRLGRGNPGDTASVGEGVSELRIHHGKGYRVYFTQQGSLIVILLCGGIKKSQDRDILEAKRLAREMKGLLQ